METSFTITLPDELIRAHNDTSVAHINEGKFASVMLTDVISTNKNLGVKYKNVCICCKDSAVQFKIHVKADSDFIIRRK